MRSVVGVLALVLCCAGSALGQSAKRCLVYIDNVDREGFKSEPIPGSVNYFAGGNVRLSCKGQNVRLGGDSLISIGGDVVVLRTKAFYRDGSFSLNADSMIYYKASEKLEARGNVVAKNLKSGSTLTGPYIDHFRAVKPLRDSAETIAIQRPTLKYFPSRGAKDSTKATPYVIVGDRLRGYGSSRFSAVGNVSIDRDSLSGHGDSLNYVPGKTGTATIFGKPGSLRRVAADSFFVTGDAIRLGLDDEALRDVTATGNGHVVHGTSDIVGANVTLAFVNEKLERTVSWDKETLAKVRSEGYDIEGDSIAIDTPGEKLKELRVFRRGRIQNPLDSTAKAPAPAIDSTKADSTRPKPAPKDRDTLWGERITAQFHQVDSAGTSLTRLLQVVSIGSARSLFSRMVTRHGTTSPSVNYARADTIVVTMKSGDSTGVAEVHARGTMDGLQLETATLRTRAKHDTTRTAPPPRRP